jgi:hypothetical protein
MSSHTCRTEPAPGLRLDLDPQQFLGDSRVRQVDKQIMAQTVASVAEG